jgi:transcriptional repressor NrdR
MRCPFCGHEDSQVKDSRPSEDNSAIRRRRHCPECGGRFTTFERVQLRELIVVKKNGRRESFDRDKLERSVNHALRKRPVERERVDRTITGIVRRLESMGENEIPANVIGELVMQALASLDKVAFRETRDFEMLIGELEGEDDVKP